MVTREQLDSAFSTSGTEHGLAVAALHQFSAELNVVLMAMGDETDHDIVAAIAGISNRMTVVARLVIHTEGEGTNG